MLQKHPKLQRCEKLVRAREALLDILSQQKNSKTFTAIDRQLQTCFPHMVTTPISKPEISCAKYCRTVPSPEFQFCSIRRCCSWVK